MHMASFHGGLDMVMAMDPRDEVKKINHTLFWRKKNTLKVKFFFFDIVSNGHSANANVTHQGEGPDQKTPWGDQQGPRLVGGCRQVRNLKRQLNCHFLHNQLFIIMYVQAGQSTREVR